VITILYLSNMNRHHTFQTKLSFKCDENLSSRSRIEYKCHDVNDRQLIKTTSETHSVVTFIPIRRQLSDLTIDQALRCEEVDTTSKKSMDRFGMNNVQFTVGNGDDIAVVETGVALLSTTTATFSVPTSVQIIDAFRCSNKLDLVPKPPTRIQSFDGISSLTKIS
jgi:hypothetical protein